MAPTAWVPDVVVGIDFGMTCTGVAYSSAPEWTDPKTIVRWPGRATHETRNKVDTCIAYDARFQSLRSWGFECNENDFGTDVNKLFKLFLDPRFIDESGFAPAYSEVQRWYVDYLSCLYAYVKSYLQERMARFALKNVEWVFSIPTTWKDPSMIAGIESMIRDAGYGKELHHKVAISLTEAEAAAVYVSKQSMQRGDIFLVCDAGGGTTDVNALKVTAAARGKTQLEPLHWNEGAFIGSTLIDFKVEKILSDRLRMIPLELTDDVESIVRDMIQGRFLSYKCAFGSGGMDVPKLTFPVPGMQPNRDIPHAGIENSRLVLLSDELRQIFDEQIERICELIDLQLKAVKDGHDADSVSYLVLSGGLGSSPYVRRRIRERYEHSTKTQFDTARGMEVLLASDPQLAVAHGLVMARTQALRGGPEVLSTRRSPVSYGVLCREVYDSKKHQGEDVTKDAFDKKRYAEKQVHWFIKQGQTVDVKDPLTQRFRHKTQYGRQHDPWRTKIVMSALPPAQLPRSAKHPGVKQVCEIETVLDLCDMSLKNDKWYNLRKMYHYAEFDVKLFVGTGLHFEIWGQQGCKSKGHEEIQVDWEAIEYDQKSFERRDGRRDFASSMMLA
ncbi:hypothetical protein CKM354_001235100 [Cercospora kikuchii]|uniref:Uncharacterized protein n=1 Tax=Cercospora kikuchii TaxID=84275 RepID=A0A9P3FLU0_9PEZI|nr:uncharacterized protein CKM354_001235100 [Cercospora kikuchii]GIZ49319.1 hypothetical protein CKM354_001235100 [Cercospora kikuchii]